MARSKSMGSRNRDRGLLLVFALICAFALPASADVDLYMSADFGISGMDGEADGQPAGVVQDFHGMDTDASPLLGGAFGVVVPMSEIVPREWLADLRLPDWPVRFELAAVGLREYDLRTVAPGSGEEFFSEIKPTTTLVNTWVDIPMVTLYRPIQYTMGLGRQPGLRRLLEPASFYLGAGVGFSSTEFDGTSNVYNASDDIIDFAWNVGAGFSYALTERVSISTGYRYVGLEDQSVDLRGGLGNDDEVDYEMDVHEFRLAIRVKLVSFRGAWR